MERFHKFVEEVKNLLLYHENFTIFDVISLGLNSKKNLEIFDEVYEYATVENLEEVMEKLLSKYEVEQIEDDLTVIRFIISLIKDRKELTYPLVQKLATTSVRDFSQYLLLSMKDKSLEEKVLKKAEKYLLDPSYHQIIFDNLREIEEIDDALSNLVSSFIDFSDVTHIPGLQNIIKEYYSFSDDQEDEEDIDQEDDE